MLPSWLTRQVAYIFGAVLLALAAWFIIAQLTGGKRAKVEAKLNRNVAEAALESGRDAVGTVGAQQAAEAATDAVTRENDRDIRNAPGADAPVDPAVRDAWLRSVCRRASSRLDPKCVQFNSAPRMGAGGS